MRRLLRPLGLLVVLALLLPGSAWALSIGTFNIEFFNVSGRDRYVDDDLRHLARSIRKSGADVLALQEIADAASLRYFLQKELPRWKFALHHSGSNQNLAFIWNGETIDLRGRTEPHFGRETFSWKGRTLNLFDRPPLAATFVDKRTGRSFTLVNVHLKSQSTQGKADKVEAHLYNEFKRGRQILRVNELASALKGIRFVLGDFNIETVVGVAFPLLTLQEGHSFDNLGVNIDHIGYLAIDPDETWRLEETETAIPRRSTARRQRPDHDIIVLHFEWPDEAEGGMKR